MVALRKESVDRNNGADNSAREQLMSLSARRAWIEINFGLPCILSYSVALRKESVDRNIFSCYYNTRIEGRSPQGERG